MIKESVEFYYGFLWSDSDAWGGEMSPKGGEITIVPKG